MAVAIRHTPVIFDLRTINILMMIRIQRSVQLKREKLHEDFLQEKREQIDFVGRDFLTAKASSVW